MQGPKRYSLSLGEVIDHIGKEERAVELELAQLKEKDADKAKPSDDLVAAKEGSRKAVAAVDPMLTVDNGQKL